MLQEYFLTYLNQCQDYEKEDASKAALAIIRDVNLHIPMKLDIFEENAINLIKEEMIKPSADVILSDMAPSTTGHKATDHLRIVALLESALDIVDNLLSEGGTFIGKVFRGGTENQILNRMKRDFQLVKHIKPQSSRSNSSELYVVGINYRK